MSKKKLIKVLGSLKPWELRAPLVAATIKVVNIMSGIQVVTSILLFP